MGIFQGIRFKVILGISTILLGTLLPFGFYQITEKRKSMISSLQERGNALAKTLADSVATPIVEFDDLNLQIIVFKAEEGHAVAYAQVFNEDKEEIVTESLVLEGKEIKKKPTFKSKDVLIATSKVLKPEGDEENASETLGHVELAFHLKEIFQRIKEDTLRYVIILSTIIIVVIVVISSFLSRSCVTPILKISKAAENLEDENYSVNVEKKDEIGSLGRVFVEMRSVVNNQKAELEKQVHERTLELNDEKDRVEKLLNTMSQAIFKVGKDLLVEGPVSSFSKKYLVRTL